jgi:hypothetical protein
VLPASVRRRFVGAGANSGIPVALVITRDVAADAHGSRLIVQPFATKSPRSAPPAKQAHDTTVAAEPAPTSTAVGASELRALGALGNRLAAGSQPRRAIAPTSITQRIADTVARYRMGDPS